MFDEDAIGGSSFPRLSRRCIQGNPYHFSLFLEVFRFDNVFGSDGQIIRPLPVFLIRNPQYGRNASPWRGLSEGFFFFLFFFFRAVIGGSIAQIQSSSISQSQWSPLLLQESHGEQRSLTPDAFRRGRRIHCCWAQP